MANPLGNKILEVRKPARYIGGEFGAACKDWNGAELRWVLAFPEIYEIGMSHMGLQILYRVLNSDPRFLADRVYTPWFDMEELLKREGQLLWALESGRSVKEFDILGITIPYELTFTNIISIIKNGGVTLLAKDRTDDEPLVIGGGCGAFNPEPVADFFDAILLGDGEEAVLKISEKILEGKKKGLSRRELIDGLATITGVYLPSMGKEQKVSRAVIADITHAPTAEMPIVPNLKLVHDRVGIEIQRGCTRGCRFCQAGMIYRPDRQRDTRNIIDTAAAEIQKSGYEECALLSLSAGDHSQLPKVISELSAEFGKKWVHISLPSLRTESLNEDVVKALSRSLQGGFTLAPEAATDRLRQVINKGNVEADLLGSVEKIFKTGWKNLKLYFMIGLPSETDEDIDAIPVLVRSALAVGRKYHKFPNITVNVSTFIPKSHTPFQWEAQISFERIVEVQQRLRSKIKGAGLKLKTHNPKISFLEGIFARGGRELSAVLCAAYEKGCRFDAWDDELKYDVWLEVLKDAGIEPEKYFRERSENEQLPWDHLFADLSKDFLIAERMKSKERTPTHDCSLDGCIGCGVCDFEMIKPVTATVIASPEGARQSPEQEIASSHSLLAMTKPSEASYRYKITFSKTDEAVFIGHLDLMNVWRRVLRRAGLSLKYSQGFNPRPKMSFGNALKLGTVSDNEAFEVQLTEKVDVESMKERIAKNLPKGITVNEIRCQVQGA